MKSFLAPAFGSMAACALLLFSSGIQAQTTIHAEGVISDYGPEALVISSGTQTVPLRYSATPDTIYVDEYGAPVSTSVIRSGVPVTVYYDRVGDAQVASRVVVRKTTTAAGTVQTKETVTTTNSSGVISDFGPNGILVRTDGAVDPVRYSSTETTTYVDEAGNPVSIETVRSGLPVTIYSYRDGDRVIASRVVVRRAATAPVVVPETRVRTETTTTVIPLDDDDDDE